MLFKDLLNERGPIVLNGFHDLFKLALENQKEGTDLLIIGLNGFYNANAENILLSDSKKASPYVIGPGKSGHSENLHYKYIHDYRVNNIYNKSHSEYLKEIEYSSEKRIQIDRLVEKESLTVQTEMLIYLKVWEMTQFLKGLYQLVRILKGENYDWHFKLKIGEDHEGIATSQELIRMFIREPLKSFSKPVYDYFKLAYNSQIRNSIAHSNYSFLGRNIHPNNDNPNAKFPQIKSLSFDKWIDMIHATILIHNSYIWFKNEINNYYGSIALENGNKLPIRINKQDGSERWADVSYRKEFNDWRWSK